MEREETLRLLNQFADYVVREARKRAPVAFGDMKRSISSEVEVGPNSIRVAIFGTDYTKFIDQGVSGTEKKYNTPFSYTTKRPPTKFLQTWLKKKTGVFRARNRKQSAFAVATSIFKYGIKPRKFLTDPFTHAFNEMIAGTELAEAYGLDIENFLDFTLNENN